MYRSSALLMNHVLILIIVINNNSNILILCKTNHCTCDRNVLYSKPNRFEDCHVPARSNPLHEIFARRPYLKLRRMFAAGGLVGELYKLAQFDEVRWLAIGCDQLSSFRQTCFFRVYDYLSTTKNKVGVDLSPESLYQSTYFSNIYHGRFLEYKIL